MDKAVERGGSRPSRTFRQIHARGPVLSQIPQAMFICATHDPTADATF